LVGGGQGTSRLRGQGGALLGLSMPVGADQAVAARPWMIHCTFDDAEHPERSRPRTLRRAAALYSLEPGPSISIEACEQLQHHAHRGGWTAIAAWLDELPAAHEGGNVVHPDVSRDGPRR
jgi:hypothetical protein